MATITFTPDKFLDISAAITIGSFNLVMSCVNLKDALIHTSRTTLMLVLRGLCVLCIVHSSIKIYDYLVTGYPDLFPVWLDVIKSFLGQLINPVAMIMMFLRALALVRVEQYPYPVYASYAVVVITFLGGLGLTCYREYLNVTYASQADKVFGGVRTTAAIITNLTTIILELLFSIAFFYELYSKLLTSSDQEDKKLKSMVLTAALEGLMMFGLAIAYCIIAPGSKPKFVTPMLQAVGVFSCRFMLDLVQGLKKASTSEQSTHGQNTGGKSVIGMKTTAGVKSVAVSKN
ncbi:hypothetical protein EDD86DRAFT_200535 [Gorgonomyces haynaldii]|nr:hypothetical protein EDD86DRAFT_200535 [Gorgonomyces haynaldii]